MPRFIGELELPHDPPHFLTIRVAVRHHLKAHPGVRNGVIVGLSGGPDSLALTAGLLAEGAKVTTISINHGLQQGSREIAEQAAATARRLGAQAAAVDVEVHGAGGMEAAARRARYAALKTSAKGQPIAVGHTTDDQAETYLLGAMRANPSGMLAVDGDVHRPLLTVRRSDTVESCRELGLQPWHDPHNDHEAFARVAMRNHVLPLLSELHGGDVTAAIAAAAHRVAADAQVLGAQAEAINVRDAQRLAHYPEALRTRAIAGWLHQLGAKVTAAGVASVDKLVVNWHGQGPVHLAREDGAQLAVTRVNGMLDVS